MKPTLEKLTKGGWEEVGVFVDHYIYRKENKRILYDPIKDEIYMRYDYKDDASTHDKAKGVEE